MDNTRQGKNFCCIRCEGVGTAVECVKWSALSGDKRENEADHWSHVLY